MMLGRYGYGDLQDDRPSLAGLGCLFIAGAIALPVIPIVSVSTKIYDAIIKKKMKQEKLVGYPQESPDEFMDAIVSGTRMGNYRGPHETSLSDGRTVVYFSSYHQGFGIPNSQYHLEVQGYKSNLTGLLKFLKKPMVRLVPNEEREGVKSKLIEAIQANQEPEYVTFREPNGFK